MIRLHAYPKLTKRQLQAYDLIVTGECLPFISKSLSVSVSTIKHRVRVILNATKCANRHELIAKHYQNVILRLKNETEIT